MKSSKRKLLRKAAALCIVLTMALGVGSISVSAENGGGTITGDSTVYAPTFNVIVPTSISLFLDPMRYSLDPRTIGTDSQSQIASGSNGTLPGYAFLNLSNVPVKMSVETTLSVAKDVYCMTQEEVNKEDVSNIDKEICFQIAPAKTATIDNAGNALAITAFNPDNIIMPNVSTTGKNPCVMNFVLDKASAPGTQAVGSKGIAAFAYQGRLNPFASWKSGDVSVSVKYSFTGISSSMYTDATAAGKMVTDGLNLASASSSMASFATSIPPSIGSAPISYYSAAALPIVVDLGSGNKAGTTISSITITRGGISQYVLAQSTDYTYSTTTKTITIPAGRFSSLSKGPLSPPYQLEVRFANGKTCSNSFTIIN